MTAHDYMAPESIGRLQQRASVVGIVGLVACGICFFLYGNQYGDRFFQSYLIAFMFVLGLSLGSLGLLMLQHLTGGHWGIMIRRPLESATRVLPLVAVFFLPIAIFGMKHLYKEWLDAPPTGEGSLSNLQKSYLTTNGFLIRAVIYFAVWLLLVYIFNRWSKEQDVNREDRALRRRLKMLAGPGIILYVFVMTFAAIDWVMSLSPHWASTIYGFLFVIGQLISSMSLMIVVLVLLSRTAPMEGIIQSRHLHDLGKLLLSFVMLWAYFGFSQLLIIWSGNLPEEISFYRTRLYGAWGVCCCHRFDLSFFRAILCSALAGSQAQRQFVGQSRYMAHLHAPGRSFLADAPGVYFESHPWFDGLCCHSGLGRNLVRCLCEKFEDPAASAAGRSPS